MLAYQGVASVNPVLRADLPYDTLRDFVPVARVATFPMALLVNTKVPVTNLQEFMALARRKPGSLSYASAGNATTSHLTMELFKRRSGVDLVHVPYKGEAPALNDVMGGQIDVAFSTLGVVLQNRYNHPMRQLRSLIDAGELGRLYLGNACVRWFRPQSYYEDEWHGTWAMDGGALMNQAIHQLDLLQWIMGPVSHVFAFAGTLAHERIEVEDTLVASLRFASGALGQLGAATSLWPGRPKVLEVYGTAGMAALAGNVLVEWRNQGDDEAERRRLLQAYGGEPAGGSSDPIAISFDDHRRQYDEFLDAVRAGRPSMLGGREGVRSVELIEAIYRSAAEVRVVALPG